MARRRVVMRALVAALVALAALVAAEVAPTDPAQFEAAFQGRCGEGSPCEQLCRELHDGTYECGCSPPYVLHVNGYGCLEQNSSKTTEPSPEAEDVLYQKDVSFSAELEVAPSIKFRPTVSPKHIIEVLNDNYTYTGERSKEEDGLRSLIEDGISKTDLNIIADSNDLQEIGRVTTLRPSLEQKVPGATSSPAWTAAVETCSCSSCDRCKCPAKCHTDTKVTTPRFSGSSWLALRALRGAYKRVRVRIRVRPERARGVLLLTGEHDDLSGDYLALMLRNGHVELRFDCGSGAGILRSPEPIRLGHWNTISVYRHRWDAWLRLNNGKRVRGRSKGLFSRMTFREPVWVGGVGNTTGLQSKLGLADGLLGCVDFLRINGDTYRLVNDAVATLDIGECAPTLAPWKPISEPTIEATSHPHSKHAIYNINDIVHFEDNDLVMRDSNIKHDNNKLDNTIERFNGFDMNTLREDKYLDLHNENDRKNPGDNINHHKDIEKDSRSNNSIKKEKHHIDKDRAIDDEISHHKALENDSIDNSSIKGKKEDSVSKEDECDCQHGGGCVNHVCLCPLGYAGVKCEITLDLKVPRFNGSSYLRLPGLGNAAASWLDIQITVKPTSGDGLLLYDSERPSGDGDFFSLHLRDYYVEFAFDLGSGIALVRSAYPLQPNKWQKVSVSRAGRRASLKVSAYGDYDYNKYERWSTRWVVSRGSGRRLSLRQPLLLGGAAHPLPPRLALTASYSGCVGQLVINDEELSVVSSALGGLNVDNCDEPNDGNCTDKNICREIVQVPGYPQNITENDIHHSIVAKKGFKLKNHKTSKKHAHFEKKKKYILGKKKYGERNVNEVAPDKETDKQTDEQTFIHVKYMSDNEIMWGDTTTYPSFTGKDSFIHIDDDETMQRLRRYTLDINIRFRSEAAHGLLVWSGRPARDFLSLAVEDAVLTLRYNLGSGEVVIIANHTRVDDGLWHRARATRNRQAGVLEVDGLGSVGKISPGKHKELNTENGLYIGGLPSIEMNTMGRYKTGLVGCVSQISLSGDYNIPLSLSKLPHTITNNVGTCVHVP